MKNDGIIKEYNQFIQSKKHFGSDTGINPSFLPADMFDFQQYVAEYAIKKGRCAVFMDTGLGKTLVELTISVNYLRKTNKRVLIITPLAVAFQFIREAEKFGIDDVCYSKDGKLKSKIVICNYERLGYFDPNDFDCVLLDESSILKNFEGATKDLITVFLKKIKYRYLFTATPSPNDFTELGTSSEALGYMGYVDMLTKFFKNNQDTISPANIGSEWILKGHAREGFFDWVSSWSISMRKPSDLGFDDSQHVLPELITNYHCVNNEVLPVVDGQMLMFNIVARTNKEINAERKSTIEKRCETAFGLADKHENSVYWCNLNAEADLIEKLDKSSKQIKGGMSLEEKEEILIAFADGQLRKLVTKPEITAFGLNWQHCGHTTYFPTFSYEKYYQAIRRFWRFGRIGPVTAELVYSDGQKRILESLMAKTEKANELFGMLNSNLRTRFINKEIEFDKKVTLPKFLSQ